MRSCPAYRRERACDRPVADTWHWRRCRCGTSPTIKKRGKGNAKVVAKHLVDAGRGGAFVAALVGLGRFEGDGDGENHL